MNTLRRRRVGRVVIGGAAVALVAGSLGLGSPAVAGTAAAAKAKPRPVIVEQPRVSPNRYFSPNGDRVYDAVEVPFRLRGKARLSVVVRPMSSDSHTSPMEGVATKRVVRHLRLGVRAPGDRSWKWRGRNDRGKVVPDGSYEITVKAKPLGKKRSPGSVSLVVDSHRTFHLPDTTGPQISLSRTTLFPDTTAIKDRIAIWGNELPGGRWDPEGTVPRLSITDAAGTVVRQQDEPTRLVWDGTNGSGARVPNGEYTVHADWSDPYGNTISRTAAVTVAAGSLVRQDWSMTYDDPSDALVQNGVECTFDCEPAAAARPSKRYPTGLSFGRDSVAVFRAVTPFPALDPVLDEVRLIVAGGPTTPGDTSSAAYYTLGGGGAQSVSGEGTTVSPWQAPGTAGSVRWSFGSRSGGYDVDSFTVDVVHWAPPAA